MFLVRCKNNRDTYVAAPGRIQFTADRKRAHPFETLVTADRKRAHPFETLEEARQEADRYPAHREVVEVLFGVLWRLPEFADDWLNADGEEVRNGGPEYPFSTYEEANSARIAFIERHRWVHTRGRVVGGFVKVVRYTRIVRP